MLDNNFGAGGEQDESTVEHINMRKTCCCTGQLPEWVTVWMWSRVVLGKDQLTYPAFTGRGREGGREEEFCEICWWLCLTCLVWLWLTCLGVRHPEVSELTAVQSPMARCSQGRLIWKPQKLSPRSADSPGALLLCLIQSHRLLYFHLFPLFFAALSPIKLHFIRDKFAAAVTFCEKQNADGKTFSVSTMRKCCRLTPKLTYIAVSKTWALQRNSRDKSK